MLPPVNDMVETVYILMSVLCMMPLSCLTNSRSCILLSDNDMVETVYILMSVLCMMSSSCFTNRSQQIMCTAISGGDCLHTGVCPVSSTGHACCCQGMK